ncbi:MAG: hypothetical protein A2Y33_10715 [Spirochaetes bacterium GWF1_51_8]|nr:MAG: hypothetical protein A2Y33_10715 [Spirochaetes bacterium GWF1_51_8]
MRFLRVYFAVFISLGALLSCSEFLTPQGVISAPYNGQTVRGIQTILVTPPDTMLVDSVYIYINFQFETLMTTSPYQYEWDTRLLTNGWCYISVEVNDQLGGLPVTDVIQVKVDNI